MSTRYVFAAVILASAPLAARAQEITDIPSDSAGVIVTHGMDTDMSRLMLIQMGASKRTQDNCWALGCLLIVNETKEYDVVGFYVDTAKAGGAPQWSRNQFGMPLQPMKVTLRFKTGRPDTCAMPIRLVMRARKSKEQFDALGTTSLCSSPHQDTLLRVKVRTPMVIVEDGGNSN